MGMRKSKPWEHQEAEESGDETWIVSYADMVTLLFGFFVILYSFSNLDDKKFEQMGETLASAFKAPEDIEKKAAADAGISNETRQIMALQLLVAMLNIGDSVDEAVPKIEQAYGDGTSAKAVKDLLTERIGKDEAIKMQSVLVGQGRESDVVDLVLPGASLFPSGSADLTPAAELKLRALAAEIRLAPGISAVEIVGHTDSAPLAADSPFKNNFSLSSLRAGAVAGALIAGGLKPDLIEVRGMGSLKPLVPERDDEGNLISENMAKNRRVHIVLKKQRHVEH
jgi:chemotaxis protein MotB